MLKYLMCICFLLLTNAACSTVAHIKTDDTPNLSLSSTDASSIKVYATSKPDRNYSIIGEVVAAADAGNDASKPVELLKEEAAKLGADAVINLRMEYIYGYWEIGLKAQGTAIKFN